jgi:NAD(P)-dependent dehydrogenase (short-subunit alcohol dehydrogenase family)
MLSKIPIGRFGAIDEVTSLICFLASEEAHTGEGGKRHHLSRTLLSLREEDRRPFRAGVAGSGVSRSLID